MAALAVAALDLKVVQLIRGAIRTADIENAKALGGALVAEAVYLPRRHLTPEPEYLPRPIIHPTPRYEPRPVIHPTPKIQFECAPAPECAGPSHPTPSPIQPPWKQLVWHTPVPPRATIKVIQYRTDIPNKGSLLDVFI